MTLRPVWDLGGLGWFRVCGDGSASCSGSCQGSSSQDFRIQGCLVYCLGFRAFWSGVDKGSASCGGFWKEFGMKVFSGLGASGLGLTCFGLVHGLESRV